MDPICLIKQVCYAAVVSSIIIASMVLALICVIKTNLHIGSKLTLCKVEKFHGFHGSTSNRETFPVR